MRQKKRARPKLLRSEIKGFSGLQPQKLSVVPNLKRRDYRLMDESVGGEAPKDSIRVYEYGNANRQSVKNWPAYIAKVGHKWYPNESITEQLLTRIGQRLGFRVADSKLMMVRGQLRLLSRNFLNRKAGETLVHGAEIFAGHLSRDSGKDEKQFVEQVEAEDMARVMFTFQFVEGAIRSEFPDHAATILSGFVDLLAFDAIVGNNDRHFFNWGVIVDIHGKAAPVLAPIYDTARALFWNTTDDKLEAMINAAEAQKAAFLRKYINNSFPKTGWDGLAKPTHFEDRRNRREGGVPCGVGKMVPT